MIKKEFINNYQAKANSYAQHRNDQGTLIIAYRALGAIFEKHATTGNLAIDIGSGTGRSRNYLQEIGFDAYGVDIDPAMIAKAKQEDVEQAHRYHLITDKIPYRDSKFDVAFSSLVILEIPTKQGLIDYFKEAARVLKPDGVMIVLTVADNFYEHDWISVDTNFPENKSPKRGDKLRIRLKEIDLELYDYYWTKDDYILVAHQANLVLIDEYYPKAPQQDAVKWISEHVQAPYSIFVFAKQ